MSAEAVRVDPKRLGAGPRAAVSSYDRGADVVERYVRAYPSDAIPSEVELTLIVRAARLSHKDAVVVVDADPAGLSVALLVRRYAGKLFFNVVTDALVEVGLGSVRSGARTIRITETTEHFSNNAGDSPAGPPHTEEYRIDIRVIDAAQRANGNTAGK